MRTMHALISASIASIILLTTAHLSAQPVDSAHITYPQAVRYLTQLKTLLAIPNDAHHPEDIQKNVEWCERILSLRGFRTSRLETASAPLLLATYTRTVQEAPVVLYYFHIDGQPVDPAFWYQDDPYRATLKELQEGQGWVDIDWERLYSDSPDPEWRIFARSSSDDKSPFVMFLAALETLQSAGQNLAYNLKVILDFEEEIGSPHLAGAVSVYADALKSDMFLIFDGPQHTTNKPTIAYGARGITTMTIKVFGPTVPLHSGHYGNYAPNPALRLARLLSGMKDATGRVTIPGYYDGIELDAEAKAILASVPDNEAELRARLGIGEVDQVGSTYQESLQYPSLNIRGLSSGWVGQEARTIVPATATAEIDLRLVVESDGDRLRNLIKQYIEDQGYYIIDSSPSSRERVMYPKICQIAPSKGITRAFRTDFNSDIGQWVFKTIRNAFGENPIRLRTMGGTLPTSPFINTLNVPAVIVPLVNSDNNQHSPNENLRLGNYFDGVKTIYALLTAPVGSRG